MSRCGPEPLAMSPAQNPGDVFLGSPRLLSTVLLLENIKIPLESPVQKKVCALKKQITNIIYPHSGAQLNISDHFNLVDSGA